MRWLVEQLLAPGPRRMGLVAYVLLLATATHWPRLRIEGPVARTDLWIHLGAFGTLGALIALAGFFGPAGSRRNLGLAWVCGVVYAAVDEGTQAIPILGRTAAWDDYAADVCGVTLGVVAIAIASAVLRKVGPWNRVPDYSGGESTHVESVGAESTRTLTNP